MKNLLKTFAIAVALLPGVVANAQDKSDWQAGVPEGCTTITVG
jgi:hypothetical protein